MDFSRRHFLERSAGFAIAFSGLHALAGRAMAGGGMGRLLREASSPGYGDLIRDPNGIVDLPAGFSYTILSPQGVRMDDGLVVPGKHDGMAAFPGPDGKTILVRNHEVNPEWVYFSPFGQRMELLPKVDRSLIFDYGYGRTPCLGGTTTLVYDTKAQRLEKHFMSLAGTHYNCAGGPMPWGSWLSCEETTAQRDDTCEVDHGWVFEVPASATPGLVKPRPIRAMGRFRHEAVAMDPRTGVLYLTEDVVDGLLYRFIPSVRPEKPGDLERGGRLQALALADMASADTSNHERTVVRTGEPVACRWIDLEEIEAPRDDLRLRGFNAGAAKFARGEGAWFADGAVYFVCTVGGRAKLGQIFKYVPSDAEGTADESARPGRLELFVEPNDASILKNADNITASPWGDLFVCEDTTGDNHLLGITARGTVYKFARNGVLDGEWAGCCFSPDGTTLFANLQGRGLTLAIRGPWRRG